MSENTQSNAALATAIDVRKQLLAILNAAQKTQSDIEIVRGQVEAYLAKLGIKIRWAGEQGDRLDIMGPDGEWQIGPNLRSTIPGPAGDEGPKGDDGRNGNTIIYGEHAPDWMDGVQGDFYLYRPDDGPRRMFGPKVGNEWGAGWPLELFLEGTDVDELIAALGNRAPVNDAILTGNARVDVIPHYTDRSRKIAPTAFVWSVIDFLRDGANPGFDTFGELSAMFGHDPSAFENLVDKVGKLERDRNVPSTDAEQDLGSPILRYKILYALSAIFSNGIQANGVVSTGAFQAKGSADTSYRFVDEQGRLKAIIYHDAADRVLRIRLYDQPDGTSLNELEFSQDRKLRMNGTVIPDADAVTAIADRRQGFVLRRVDIQNYDGPIDQRSLLMVYGVDALGDAPPHYYEPGQGHMQLRDKANRWWRLRDAAAQDVRCFGAVVNNGAFDNGPAFTRAARTGVINVRTPGDYTIKTSIVTGETVLPYGGRGVVILGVDPFTTRLLFDTPLLPNGSPATLNGFEHGLVSRAYVAPFLMANIGLYGVGAYRPNYAVQMRMDGTYGRALFKNVQMGSFGVNSNWRGHVVGSGITLTSFEDCHFQGGSYEPPSKWDKITDVSIDLTSGPMTGMSEEEKGRNKTFVVRFDRCAIDAKIHAVRLRMLGANGNNGTIEGVEFHSCGGRVNIGPWYRVEVEAADWFPPYYIFSDCNMEGPGCLIDIDKASEVHIRGNLQFINAPQTDQPVRDFIRVQAVKKFYFTENTLTMYAGAKVASMLSIGARSENIHVHDNTFVCDGVPGRIDAGIFIDQAVDTSAVYNNDFVGFPNGVARIGNQNGPQPETRTTSYLGAIRDLIPNIPRHSNPLFYWGYIGDGGRHPLSSVVSFRGTSTAGWTLAQWRTIFPGAQALTSEIDRLAIQRVIDLTPAGGTVRIELPPTGLGAIEYPIFCTGNRSLHLVGSGREGSGLKSFGSLILQFGTSAERTRGNLSIERCRFTPVGQCQAVADLWFSGQQTPMCFVGRDCVSIGDDVDSWFTNVIVTRAYIRGWKIDNWAAYGRHFHILDTSAFVFGSVGNEFMGNSSAGADVMTVGYAYAVEYIYDGFTRNDSHCHEEGNFVNLQAYAGKGLFKAKNPNRNYAPSDNWTFSVFGWQGIGPCFDIEYLEFVRARDGLMVHDALPGGASYGFGTYGKMKDCKDVQITNNALFMVSQADFIIPFHIFGGYTDGIKIIDNSVTYFPTRGDRRDVDAFIRIDSEVGKAKVKEYGTAWFGAYPGLFYVHDLSTGGSDSYLRVLDKMIQNGGTAWAGATVDMTPTGIITLSKVVSHGTDANGDNLIIMPGDLFREAPNVMAVSASAGRNDGVCIVDFGGINSGGFVVHCSGANAKNRGGDPAYTLFTIRGR